VNHRRLFPGFEQRLLPTPRGPVNAMVGGSGPPVLLLHGYPESLLMWHDVAALLSERHTVVAADLAGYGGSFRPDPTPDHRPHSKRAMAGDQVEAMAALGFDSFAVVGHDRGGRVAYRMALDHPERVTRLAVLDIVPTAEVWARADAALARLYWHWSFLSLPAPLPERLIGGDPGALFDLDVRGRQGLGSQPGHPPAEVLDTYRRAFADPAAVEAICEDYRAGATVDVEDDEADRAAERLLDFLSRH
jgi:haloacetate dehalogenase